MGRCTRTVEKGPGSLNFSLNFNNTNDIGDVSFSFDTSNSAATSMENFYLKWSGPIARPLEVGFLGFESSGNSDFSFAFNAQNVSDLIEGMQDLENSSDILENLSGDIFLLFEGRNQFRFNHLYFNGKIDLGLGSLEKIGLSGSFNFGHTSKTKLLIGVNLTTLSGELILSKNGGLGISNLNLSIAARINESLVQAKILCGSFMRTGGFYLKVNGGLKSIISDKL